MVSTKAQHVRKRHRHNDKNDDNNNHQLQQVNTTTTTPTVKVTNDVLLRQQKSRRDTNKNNNKHDAKNDKIRIRIKQHQQRKVSNVKIKIIVIIMIVIVVVLVVGMIVFVGYDPKSIPSIITIIIGSIFNIQQQQQEMNGTEYVVSNMLHAFCNHNKNNQQFYDPSQTTTSSSVQRMIQCHPSLGVGSDTNKNHNRTIIAQHKTIRAYETILHISKQYTIWDIDAIFDPWIQENIILPNQQQQQYQNHATNNRSRIYNLSPEAYLAVYIARLIFHSDDSNHNNHSVMTKNTSSTNYQTVDHQLLHQYIQTLPHRKEDFHHHPILWSDTELQNLLGTYTITYHTILSIQQMIYNEYIILNNISTIEFKNNNISYDEYIIGRLNVLTRSFGTGPIDWSKQSKSSSSTTGIHDEIKNKIEFIQQQMSYFNFTNGHHVMVPILDQFNHHGQQYNVDFHYNQNKHTFIVQSIKPIYKGMEIIDSYGKHTQSHLFAKYGFINYYYTDDTTTTTTTTVSDYNEATIALWHTPTLHIVSSNKEKKQSSILDEQQQQQQGKYKVQMLRYLQYDDGYESCIGDPNLIQHSSQNYDLQFLYAAWNFKQLKYQFLINNIGIDASRWTIQMVPSSSVSRGTNNVLPKIKAENIQQLLSTCRLLVLRHDDYNSTAIDILQNNMNNTNYYLPSPFSSDYPSSSSTNNVQQSQDHALEFRTYMCLVRMIQTAMIRFPKQTVSKQLEYIKYLQRQGMNNPMTTNDKTDQQQQRQRYERQYIVAHLHYSELQTLETMKQILFSHLRQHYESFMKQSIQFDSNETKIWYTMRDTPCTFEQYLKPLLKLQ